MTAKEIKDYKLDTFTTYQKDGKGWKATYTEESPARARECLMRDLYNHFINKVQYIKRITDKCNYDGTRTITVYCQHENISTFKYVYIVHL